MCRQSCHTRFDASQKLGRARPVLLAYCTTTGEIANAEARSVRRRRDRGLLAGTVWLLISLALDVPFFIFGPEQMRMSPDAYMADIGFTYVMIPIIVGTIGLALARR